MAPPLTDHRPVTPDRRLQARPLPCHNLGGSAAAGRRVRPSSVPRRSATARATRGIGSVQDWLPLVAEETGRWELRPRAQRMCPHCQQGVEDVPHLLFVCPLYGQVHAGFSVMTCSWHLCTPCASSCSRTRCSCLLWRRKRMHAAAASERAAAAGGEAAWCALPPLCDSCFLPSPIVGTAGLEPLPLTPQSMSCVPARLNGL